MAIHMEMETMVRANIVIFLNLFLYVIWLLSFGNSRYMDVWLKKNGIYFLLCNYRRCMRIWQPSETETFPIKSISRECRSVQRRRRLWSLLSGILKWIIEYPHLDLGENNNKICISQGLDSKICLSVYAGKMHWQSFVFSKASDCGDYWRMPWWPIV